MGLALCPQPMAYPATVPQPNVEGPGFLQRVMDAVRGMAVSPNLSPSPNAAKSVADILDTLKTNPLPGSQPNVQSTWQNIDESPLGQGAQGLVAGMTHMPTDLLSTVGAMGANTGGLLFNSPGMKQAGYDIGQWGDAKRQEALKLQKIDPNAMTPTQKNMEWIGQNISPTLPATLLSGASNLLGQYVTGPLGQKIGQTFPIPSLGELNPFDTRPAQAATVFGRPPTIINTPGGPVALNDEELSGMIEGGIMTMGFGASLANVSRVIRSLKEDTLPSIRNMFDPRRPTPGAPGTESASIPSDILKGGILDRYQAMADIADRQARYENGTSVGIDPVGGEAVRQKWRIQTGSGAQNKVEGVIQRRSVID